MLEAYSLGEFEQVVLLAILRLEGNAYGFTIGAEIVARTGRKPSPGALYATLERLKGKGFVASRVGDPTPVRGGRAKRFFDVTGSGVKAVARSQRAYQRLLDGLTLPGVVHA